MTAWIRFSVALLAVFLLLTGPLVPAVWVAWQAHDGSICTAAPPGAPYRLATGAEGSWSTSWWPPRLTCTYRFGNRAVVLRHDAPHRDAAAALMAMGLVLAIAAYAAPGRKPDGLAAARG